MGQKHDMTITPDLQSREAVMLAAGRAQFAVTTDEGTRYVRFDCKRKNDGPGKRYEQATLDEATHVFVSEKGYGTESLGTYYPPREGYATGRFFTDLPYSDGHMQAVLAIVDHVNGQPVEADIQAESRCGLCFHELTDPVSIKRGIGPECAGKPTGTKILHASAFTDKQEALDVEPPDLEQAARQALEDERAMDDVAARVEAINERIAYAHKAKRDLDLEIAGLEAERNNLTNQVPF